MKRTRSKPNVVLAFGALGIIALFITCQMVPNPPASNEPRLSSFNAEPTQTAAPNPVASPLPTNRGEQPVRANMVAVENRAEAVRKAEAERLRYLATYRNASPPKPANAISYAVSVSLKGTSDAAFTSLLAQKLSREGVSLNPAFFTPQFVKGGLFDEAFAESASLFEKLELRNAVDGLLLARASVLYATNAALEGLVSATLTFDLKTVPLSSSVERKSWKYQTVGPGFNTAAARLAAEERLFNEITGDTNFTLLPRNTHLL